MRFSRGISRLFSRLATSHIPDDGETAETLLCKAD